METWKEELSELINESVREIREEQDSREMFELSDGTMAIVFLSVYPHVGYTPATYFQPAEEYGNIVWTAQILERVDDEKSVYCGDFIEGEVEV